MLNDAWPQYLSIRLVILLLHSIGPACTAYTATLARRTYLQSQWPSLNALQVWCVAETAFYAFFLYYRTRLQREAVHPPLRSKEDRKVLFNKVLDEIHDIEKFLSGWFRGAKLEEIGRDDVKEFAIWAFWEGRLGVDDKEELEGLVQRVEKMVGREFQPGKGGAKSLRLTVDPIEMECRSLLWYGIIMLVDTVSHIRLLVYGMQYHSTPTTTLAVFPPRPLAAITGSARSPAKNLSYWLKPHTSKTRLPILFLHGIGVGLHPHIDFLHELDVALNSTASPDDQVGILSLEILQISSRLTHRILTRAEFLRQITQILDAQPGWEEIVLVSHSYGSVLSTHMLTDATMAKRVSACFLVDPVTILLHMPDVAYNFTVRKPRLANEWQLWYFASKDAGVAYTLGRHFFWSENLLWRDHLVKLVEERGMRVTVSLAERDLIVDTPAVGAYLMEGKVPDPVVVGGETEGKHMELETSEKKKQDYVKGWKTRPWKGQGLEVMWWDDLDHAQVFDEKGRRARLVEVLVEYSNRR